MLLNEKVMNVSLAGARLIDLPHQVCDFACPSIGLEDMYEGATGSRLPDYVIMDLSMLGFMYIRQKNAPAPRMVYWGNGTGKPQHRFLEDVIGYHWTYQEGQSFEAAFKAVTASIDRGQPVILGLLDMFHLPYFEKMYHRFHVPYHYVLMVGYDLKKEQVYVHDNSRVDIQSVPVQDLKGAWNVNIPGLGKKNAYTIISLDPSPADLETVLRRGLKKRAAWMFEPPVGFMGLPGLRRLAKDIGSWATELEPRALKASLEHLAMFTCTKVPMPPARLVPQAEDNGDSHQAVRDRFAAMLLRFGAEFGVPAWLEASGYLSASGKQIGLLTDRAVDALQGDAHAMSDAGEILEQVAKLEEQAFGALL